MRTVADRGPPVFAAVVNERLLRSEPVMGRLILTHASSVVAIQSHDPDVRISCTVWLLPPNGDATAAGEM